MSQVVLHNFFRSSTSIRVRTALHLKGIAYAYRSVSLGRAEHHGEPYLRLNPEGLVPALEIDGRVLTQSMAIMEYLDECQPQPPLLPPDAAGRARVRALAYAVACDIHPLNNLRVLNELRAAFGADQAAIAAWFGKWVAAAFGPLEQRLAREPETGRFCHGDTPTLADICLSAQVLNNTRFDVDMAPYPTIRAIHEQCMALEAFQKSAPAAQPDAE